MIKKIKVEQLEPGMFIHDLNCGWMKHPFMGNRMKIKDRKIIEKVTTYGIQEVYIDTSKGMDVIDAPTQAEVDREIQKEIEEAAETKREIKKVPMREELVKAVTIKKEAKQTIENIMNEVRFGKQIKAEKVEHVVEKMIESIFRNEDALVSLGRIRNVDEYTYVHSMSVSILMLSFGKYLRCEPRELKEIGVGAMLHDIGKMKIPSGILKKNVQLTDTEYNIVRGHVDQGRRLLEETKGITEKSILLALQHHERVDGTGYPNRLKAGEIEKFAQMAAIADVYDAMTSKRCYQRRYEPTEVLKKLYEWSGSLFDKELVHQFVRCIGIYPVGTLVHLENHMLGVVISHGVESLLRPVVRIAYDIRGRRYVTPYDVDLSQPEGKGGEYKILSYASQDKWNINPGHYLS
jgi:HD-GYP domain-containing protein (c-di-GMP phosphodiesterase class II)